MNKIIILKCILQTEEVKPSKTVNLMKKPVGTITHKVKLFNHLYNDSISLMTENKLK